MILFDSVKKSKVEFVPIRAGEVRIYLCGPTVYDDAHLGHARSAISFDLLRRVLVANGLKVKFVKNFTDIDDKIVKKSLESGKSVESITAVYTQNYLNDMAALGVDRADLEPKVTENLDNIFSMISELLARGKAYKVANGDIYMRVGSDERYGSLSHRENLESQQSRISKNELKEDERDFALWKVFDDGVVYDSPFGKGRPGWHIECSAIIQSHLAYESEKFSIDIHAGGSDLLFPHHENEASQSRCVNDKELAKYWLHNGFVNIDGEKMSKSLGNSFFIKDALKHYDGEVLRYYLLSTHYRAALNFSTLDLVQSKKRLDKIYRLKSRLKLEYDGVSVDKKFRNALLNALNDDLNISIALSEVDSMLSNYNEILDKNPKDKIAAQLALSNLAYISEILGIGKIDCVEYFHIGVSDEVKSEIERQIELRSSAKAEKNYALADKIRDELKAKNIILLDTKDGVIWEYHGE